jgi:3-isopropylmalate/(R)-2-methylmalate dehydratase small subunit
MEAFQTRTLLAAAFDRPNVDTDLIVPKQFLTSIERAGFGLRLFHNVRFLDNGEENPEFFLNFPRYKGAGLLVGGENFGCGSSREHAAWALLDYGFKVVVAPSFGDIFRNNGLKVGLLLIELPAPTVSDFLARIEATPGYEATVDLAAQTITGSDGWVVKFEIDPFNKEWLLAGGDEIDRTLAFESKISAYEKAHSRPWEAALPNS